MSARDFIRRNISDDQRLVDGEPIKEALDLKADASATTAALSLKADEATTTTALAGKQPLDATLTALAALATAANKMLISTGVDALATADFINAGTFTPNFTLETPGTLSVSYSTQNGRYIKIGNWVACLWILIFTPTYGTGTGVIRIGGFPFAAANEGISGAGELSYHSQNIVYPTGPNGNKMTKAGLLIDPIDQFCKIRTLGSGENSINLQHSNMGGGVSTTLSGWLMYKAA